MPCFTSWLRAYDPHAVWTGRRAHGRRSGGSYVFWFPVNQCLTWRQGGYNLDSISKSALAVTRVLLGQAPDELPSLKANELATETVWLVSREQSKYWKSVDPKACDPQEGRPYLWRKVNLGLTVSVDFEPISFSIPGMTSS